MSQSRLATGEHLVEGRETSAPAALEPGLQKIHAGSGEVEVSDRLHWTTHYGRTNDQQPCLTDHSLPRSGFHIICVKCWSKWKSSTVRGGMLLCHATKDIDRRQRDVIMLATEANALSAGKLF